MIIIRYRNFPRIFIIFIILVLVVKYTPVWPFGEGEGEAVRIRGGFGSFRRPMLAPECQCAPAADVGHTHTRREFNAVTDRDQSCTMGTLNVYTIHVHSHT
jgi:hypothetical protein